VTKFRVESEYWPLLHCLAVCVYVPRTRTGKSRSILSGGAALRISEKELIAEWNGLTASRCCLPVRCTSSAIAITPDAASHNRLWRLAFRGQLRRNSSPFRHFRRSRKPMLCGVLSPFQCSKVQFAPLSGEEYSTRALTRTEKEHRGKYQTAIAEQMSCHKVTFSESREPCTPSEWEWLQICMGVVYHNESDV
jgi:hypothetical protein